MNSQHASWTHTGIAFGFGLAFLKPWLLLAAVIVFTITLGSWSLLRLTTRHWPGLAAFVKLAADFVMLLMILTLLLSVLWLLPAFLPPG